MPILKIWRDSRGRAECRSCHAPIEWAELITGKRIPFDAPIVAVRTHHTGIGERVIEDVDTEITYSHFATCPDADRWRRR